MLDFFSCKWRDFKEYTSHLPIVIFYMYLWKNNRALLFKTTFVSYLLPLLLEISPWFLSPRKAGSILRLHRIKLTHNMTTKKPFSPERTFEYFYLTIIHAFIYCLVVHLRSRVISFQMFS
eukprot:TRINITY_DN5561_c0_g2_i3.p1 TRINITY_DN5561_c0_g2~~TRINITY_DN5561_c0_g2_i3.p1  ORF type:complete len:120 (+),score=10.51 TRINITY_DN5561_c0_g2_i3:27-386(+)